MPTLLGLHDVPLPAEVLAEDLEPILADPSSKGTDSAVFGVFGGPIGVTDGQHVLYHYPPDIEAEGLREYTLMPTHMTDFFRPDELSTATLSPAFNFTKGAPLLSIAALGNASRPPLNDKIGFDDLGTRLYDVKADPAQKTPIENETISKTLLSAAIQTLKDHDTPKEVFDWYQLDPLNFTGRNL